MIYLAIGILAAAGAWWLRRLLHRRRRERLRRQPMDPLWEHELHTHVPLYARLPDALRHELHGLMHIFLDEKRFYGQGGLEVTAAMRVRIAAHACLMLLNRDTDIYPGFTSILIYPDTYVAAQTVHDGAVRSEQHSLRAGESWMRGPVILSWRDTHRGNVDADDGSNVVLHEFAHKLDEEDGRMDGLPLLNDAEQYRTWANVLSREFAALREAVARHHKTVMDEYGATSAAEFFAVATETFFEKPQTMQKKHPELYRELQQYFRLDPADWL